MDPGSVDFYEDIKLFYSEREGVSLLRDGGKHRVKYQKVLDFYDVTLMM